MDEYDDKVLFYSSPDWSLLPDSILLEIFYYLNVSHIPIISTVCRAWHRVSEDEFLWRHFFYEDFVVKKGIPIAPGKSSWHAEYQRLVTEIPLIESECLEEHNHQVLHVSFSHNGKLFTTTSKDGYVVVWSSKHPVEVLYYMDMKVYSWKYTQFSQFNSTDTLLLVSGVHFGSASTSGEIAIFNLEKGFRLQCRVQNKPYDIFGTWYNNEYLLSGELKWLGQMVSANIIWLNKANQELHSEHEVIISRLYQFYNINASNIRTLMVANCLTPENKFRANEDGCEAHSNYPLTKPGRKQSLDKDCDKYLIFTTGSKTYSPHQIGLKRIVKFEIPTYLDVGPCIRERLERERLRKERVEESPNWLDYESVQHRFDKVDHVIDLHGHIIGICLSPDHRYLYVNSRRWPTNYVIENPLDAPVIDQKIDIHVIDLVTLKEVGTLLRSHKAFTPNAECFFIFLDVSDYYVASGGEDKHGYVWDRYYEVCLAKLPHRDVVNSVAFNPVDPEMMVSVSDDHTIKVWRSRRQAKELNIKITKDNTGQEMRKKHSVKDDAIGENKSYFPQLTPQPKETVGPHWTSLYDK